MWTVRVLTIPGHLEAVFGHPTEPLLHRAHNPDIAPSEFLLSGHIKGTLSAYSCASLPDLLKMIVEFCSQIDEDMLMNVLESWVKQLQSVMKSGREYHLK
jgi:hypothetical protein